MPPSEPGRDWAVVLAAGAGRRMGGPKALMQAGGRDWWRIQQERLNSAGIPSVWVVSPAVLAAWEATPDAPHPLVLGDSELPMFDSVIAGVRVAEGLEARGVFVLPVDVPAPAPMVWERLAAAAEVAIPSHRGRRGHPVYIRSNWLQSALRRAPHENRLDALIAPVAVEVPVHDASITTNLNTPADVEAWLRESAAIRTR